MKIKDIIDMKGKYSANDVGEVEIGIDEDYLLQVLINENLGFCEDYICELAETICCEAKIKEVRNETQDDRT